MNPPTLDLSRPFTRIVAFALSPLAGYALNEITSRNSGRSAVDSLGLVLVAVSAACGFVAGLVHPRARTGERASVAATFCLGMLVSGAFRDQLNLLPFAVLFVALSAGLPFFIGASLGRAVPHRR